MGLSLQSQFSWLLKGDNGKFLDCGVGNLSGEPCISNLAFLYERGWRGIGMELDERLAREAATMFAPEAIILQGDCLQPNWQEIFDKFNMPKIFDYVSIDIDDGSLSALKKFFETDRKFDILTIETDEYNPGGTQRKFALMDYMKDKDEYKLVVESVGLSFCSKNYLENWYIRKDAEFLIPEVKDMFWSYINPHYIIDDLYRLKRWN